jgi:hypothetical protein
MRQSQAGLMKVLEITQKWSGLYRNQEQPRHPGMLVEGEGRVPCLRTTSSCGSARASLSAKDR